MQKLLPPLGLRFALFTLILSCSAYAHYYLYAQQAVLHTSGATAQEVVDKQNLKDLHSSKPDQPAEEEPMILPDIQLLQDILERGRKSIPILNIF